MRSDFWIIALILGVLFSALLAFSYMNRRRMGPARRRARAQQRAFCRVHGKKMGQEVCRKLFVGLPPAVWADLSECEGTDRPEVCRARRLCDMGSSLGCLVAGKLTEDVSLVAKACKMGYRGPECTQPEQHTPDIQAAVMGLDPTSRWSWEALAYSCGEGNPRACGLIPQAWFHGKVYPEALKTLNPARVMWTEACLWGDMHSCTMAALSWNHEPLLIYACLNGDTAACRHAKSGDPVLGAYLSGIGSP